jgi:NADH oxidase (H2O2-forming)
LKIVVIGAGIAGVTAAETIRRLNKDCEITLVSEEEPLYSPCIFPKCLSKEIDLNKIFIKKVIDLQKENINFLKQKAIRIDKNQKKVFLTNGVAIKFDKLILSTGSQPIIPPIEGVRGEGVFTFKSLNDFMKVYDIAHKEKGSAVIIGGGVIGVEIAYALKKIGWDIYLIESLNRILPRLLDLKLSLLLKNIMENNGVHILTGEKAKKINRVGEKVESVITDKREIKCDIVILTVGMRPRTELAREAGIELGQYGGIKVNPYMMTNINNIYACGDCIETEEISSRNIKLSLLWHTAKLQGHIAGYNVSVQSGIQKKYPGTLNLTIIDVFDIYVISNANTLDDFKEEVKVIEKEYEGNYLRILTNANGKIVSIQFLGKNLTIETFGPMFGIMRKGEETKILLNVERKEEIYSLLLTSSFIN